MQDLIHASRIIQHETKELLPRRNIDVRIGPMLKLSTKLLSFSPRKEEFQQKRNIHWENGSFEYYKFEIQI